MMLNNNLHQVRYVTCFFFINLKAPQSTITIIVDSIINIINLNYITTYNDTLSEIQDYVKSNLLSD